MSNCPIPPDAARCTFVNTLIEIDAPKSGTTTTRSVMKSIRGQKPQAPACNDGMETD